jgi:hypothetical protein
MFFRTCVSKVTIYPSQEKRTSPLIDHEQRINIKHKYADTHKQTIIAEF